MNGKKRYDFTFTLQIGNANDQCQVLWQNCVIVEDNVFYCASSQIIILCTIII